MAQIEAAAESSGEQKRAEEEGQQHQTAKPAWRRFCPPGPKFRCCLIGLAVALGYAIFWGFRVLTAECTLDRFDVRLLLPENAAAVGVGERFERATRQNTPALDSLDLDLGGVWWMDGNPNTYEQLISFAGSTGSPPYPAKMLAPFSYKRRWTWGDHWLGRWWAMAHSLSGPVDAIYEFNFPNRTYAAINPSAFGVQSSEVFHFQKINENEWDRPPSYVLRRVVNTDGTAGPFWQKFIDWYVASFPSGAILVQNTDNMCKRRCQYFTFCFVCNIIC